MSTYLDIYLDVDIIDTFLHVDILCHICKFELFIRRGQISYIYYAIFYFIQQLIGRSFGKTGPLQTLLRQLEKHTVISNPGYDTIYSKLPWLRFLPLPASKAYATVSKIRLDLIDQLDKLSVCYIREFDCRFKTQQHFSKEGTPEI